MIVTRKHLGRALKEALEPRRISDSVAEQAVGALFERIILALEAGERVTISGFGRFHVIERPSYLIPHHPYFGTPTEIAAHRETRFRPGTSIKRRLR
jgi:nucleoid DNA-binding protein